MEHTHRDLIDIEIKPHYIKNHYRSRLERLVPRNDMSVKEAVDKKLCLHCRAELATMNFKTYCEQCWFYLKNEFNDKVWQQ